MSSASSLEDAFFNALSSTEFDSIRFDSIQDEILSDDGDAEDDNDAENQQPDDAPTGESSGDGSGSTGGGQGGAERFTASGDGIASMGDDDQEPNSDNALINTIGDALSMLEARFKEQIDKAVVQNASFNVAIRGDTEAKTAFYTLLPVAQQRFLFLRIASSQRSWPRLRPLFGAPPYGFLTVQDSGILNATGIARARMHMAYEENKIANYSQFGTGQLTDEHEREYRVVESEGKGQFDESDILPSSLSSMDGNNRVHLIVRVQKRSKQERIRRMKNPELRKTITFPLAGETIVLRETKRLLKLQGRVTDSRRQNVMRVLQVKPRDFNASTAAVLAMRA